MNKTNFTRKQWKLVGAGSEYDVICDSGLEEPYYIAQVYDDADNATAFDNAHLIAAAPEMYEQCERMRNFLSSQYGEDDPFVKDADIVLSKARGEA